MNDAIQVINIRIKELQSIIGNTSVKNGFSANARLVEAKYILELLKKSDKS